MTETKHRLPLLYLPRIMGKRAPGGGPGATRGQMGGPETRGPGTLTTQKSGPKGPFAKSPGEGPGILVKSVRAGGLASMP